MATRTDEVDAPIHVESAVHLQELIDQYDVVLVDYHAEWCGPCKLLEPVVAEIASETDAVIAKVDVDELQGLASERGIRGVPTMEFYGGGERAERIVGVRDKDSIVGIIESLT